MVTFTLPTGGNVDVFSVHPGYIFDGIFENQFDHGFIYYLMKLFSYKP